MTRSDIPRSADDFHEWFANRELVYSDASDLLVAARRFEKIEDSYRQQFHLDDPVTRIAVVGSMTVTNLKSVLKIHLYAQSIVAKIYEAPFGSLTQQALEKDSGLYQFAPDIVFLIPDYQDVDVPYLHPARYEELKSLPDREADRYSRLWRSIHESLPCAVILHSLFAIPYLSPLGALEFNQPYARHNIFRRLNLKLVENGAGSIVFLDFDFFASLVGKTRWFDPNLFFRTKQSIGFSGIGVVCFAAARLICSVQGRMRKCLIVDLDNTLWGGVIGDDGIEAINVDRGDPAGEAFVTFQEYIKQMKERGVILAVCSKNELDIAMQPFEQISDMPLKLDDIACFVANWESKAENVKRIASELNIGLDALVFFDDNPAERMLVKSELPEVEVIDVPEDPAYFIEALDGARCFDWATITEEDQNRTDTYSAESKRRSLESNTSSYELYLSELKMFAEPTTSIGIHGPRFNQLINKTNQFNLTGARTTETMLQDLSKAPDKYKLIKTDLSDRFANHGIISCMILEKVKNFALIRVWVMSCRVFKRGVENLMLGKTIEAALEWGCDVLVGEYVSSGRNGLVENLYTELGFKKRVSKIKELETPLSGLVYFHEIPSDDLKTEHRISIKQ